MGEIQTLFFGLNPYVLLALVMWTLPWKAWALWLSARRGDIWWFLAMMFLSTLALLEIVYIFFIAKQTDTVSPAPEQETTEE